ncbi:MAG: DUF4113 domain-containing protein, partial [Spirochaetota bacterium]
SAAGCISVFIGTNRFKNEPQYANSASFVLPRPSLSSVELCRHAALLLERIFREGYCYKKTGVMLTGLVAAESMQLDLFEDPLESARQHKVMKVMDEINSRYGSGAVTLAAEGMQKKWAMRREHLSPCYTTRWSDIPRVRLC